MTQPHEDSAPSQPERQNAPRPVIAIDGPAGAGKSTLAAHLARRFGFLNLETGAMYRALALKAIENDFAFDEEASAPGPRRPTPASPWNHSSKATASCSTASTSPAASARPTSPPPPPRSPSIPTSAPGWSTSSEPSAHAGGVVMEGRDIGTAVFPDAEVKIFLDAAPEVRGNRRFRQVAPTSRPASGSRHPQGNEGARLPRPQPRRVPPATRPRRRHPRLHRHVASIRFCPAPKRSSAPTCLERDSNIAYTLSSDKLPLLVCTIN